MSIRKAAASNDELKVLKALRDRLAADLDASTDARDVAPLARQLQIVAARISELEPSSEVSIVDQLAARRAARIADADVSGGAAGGS